MAKNILILNMTRMGDLIQSTPVIAGLRRQYPEACITLMVTSGFAEFSKRIPGIDDTVVFDLKQFQNKETINGVLWIELYRYLESVLNGLKARQYDLLINLSHSKFSAFINSYLGIKTMRGFACNETGDRMTLDPWMQYFGTEPFNRLYNPFNLVEIFTRSVEAAPEEHPLHIRTEPKDADSIAQIVARENIKANEFLIGVQAGSSLEGRRWPASAFAELADRLVDRFGARILLFGVASESGLAGEIRSLVRNRDRLIDLAGKTDISQLTALVKRCSYLVTNDTGTMHIAAAVGTPIVGLFFAHAHPFETGPYSPGHLIFQARIPCAPCSYGVECNNIVCIQKVRPEHLLSMIEVHHKEGRWRLPDTMEYLEEVNLFQTCIGKDRRLRLQPLIRHPLTLGDIFRECYTRLWLDSLGTVPVSGAESFEIADPLRKDYNCSDLDDLSSRVAEKIGSLRDLEKLARRGVRLAEDIVRTCASRKPGKGARLKVLGDRIESLDEEINRLGCTHPEIKPVSDMFCKRKENFQGDDPVRLARETGDCYSHLLADGSGLMGLLSEVIRGLKREGGAGFQTAASSINVEVPGR